MKRLALTLCVVFGAMAGGEAKATDDFAVAVEGAYLLVQEDEFQRILSFERTGNVASVSDQQASYGFTSGQGAWKRTGQSEVTATLVDFSYSIEDGSALGPSLIVYVMTFSDEVAPGPDDWDRARKFQTVTGSYSGKQYAFGQNPLAPTEPATREFGIGFVGQRITAE